MIFKEDQKMSFENENEGYVAHKKAGEPKLVGEGKSYKDWTKAADDAYQRVQKAKSDRNAANKEFTQKDTKEKGVKFYDKKGSGRLVNGRKVYDRR